MDSLEGQSVGGGSSRRTSREQFSCSEVEMEHGLEITVNDLHGGKLTALLMEDGGKRVVRLTEYVARPDIDERVATSIDLFGRIMDRAQEEGVSEIQIPVDAAIPGGEQMAYITDIAELLGEKGAEEITKAREFYGRREARRASDTYFIRIPIEAYQEALMRRLAQGVGANKGKVA